MTSMTHSQLTKRMQSLVCSRTLSSTKEWVTSLRTKTSLSTAPVMSHVDKERQVQTDFSMFSSVKALKVSQSNTTERPTCVEPMAATHSSDLMMHLRTMSTMIRFRFKTMRSKRRMMESMAKEMLLSTISSRTYSIQRKKMKPQATKSKRHLASKTNANDLTCI